MPVLPLDIFRKKQWANPEEALGAVCDCMRRRSQHVDLGDMYLRLVQKDMTFGHVERIAEALSIGWVLGRAGGPRSPNDQKDLARILHRDE